MEENVLDLVEQKNISENSLRSWRHPVAFGFVWAHGRKDVMKTLDPAFRSPAKQLPVPKRHDQQNQRYEMMCYSGFGLHFSSD